MTRFKKIVVGIDFSDASLAGARWVATHLAPGAELLLVHVIAVPTTPTYLREHMGSTIGRSSRMPGLYSALREFADLLRPHRVRVGIRTGVPWSMLAHVASEVKADLVCVGRGPQRQGSARFGATTPQRLLGVSHVPVLVIPQGVVARPTRVICALSGRPGGEGVIPLARQLAIEWGSSLEPVHAIETDIREHRSLGIDPLDEGVVGALAGEWVAATLADAGAAASHGASIRVGDAGQMLVSLAQAKPAQSVIVMGRMGEGISSGWSHSQFRCGSTTRMVLWAAPCPVLVVPLESPAIIGASSADGRALDSLVLAQGERGHRQVPLTRSLRSPYNGDDVA